jgi:hypothetical protein
MINANVPAITSNQNGREGGMAGGCRVAREKSGAFPQTGDASISVSSS